MHGFQYSYDFFPFTASEMMVTRTFPVGSLVKEKKTSGNFRIGPKQWAHECLQLRASTFQVTQQIGRCKTNVMLQHVNFVMCIIVARSYSLP